MNIALVTETFPPEVNGVAMTYGVIVRELSRRRHSITVYRPRWPHARETASKVGADWQAVGLWPRYRAALGSGPRSTSAVVASPTTTHTEVSLPGIPVPGYPQLRVGLPAGRKLRAWWRAKRPDLVHVATEGPLGNSAVTIANELKIPVTSGFHTNFHTYAKDYGFALLRRPVLQWLRRFHNRTRRTFAPTPELCAQLSALGFENMAVLSRGVDTHDFDPERRDHELRASWGASADTPVVIHVGRMAVEKNYDLLFRVYAAMAAANPRLKLVLAGEGPLEARLKREHPECVFVGFFSRREIGRYYAAADIYVHASLTETFGNVLTEAMASGLAVAGFNYAAAKQFIVNGVNGLTVPCGEPDALVAAGVKLAKDSLLRERLRREARSAVLRQSWSEVIGGFESALLQIAGATATEPEIAVA